MVDEVNNASLSQRQTFSDEFRFKIYDTMEMSPAKVTMDDLMKRLAKEHKFSVKVIKLVQDTEDMDPASPPSLADCWRWIKGLLYDFLKMKHV